MDYKYKVWRDNDKVFYQIKRGEVDVVEPKEMIITDLSLFTFIITMWNREATISALLKKAHKFAIYAIKNLNKYETYQSNEQPIIKESIMNKIMLCTGIVYISYLTTISIIDLGNMNCGIITTWIDVAETFLIIGIPFALGYFGRKP